MQLREIIDAAIVEVGNVAITASSLLPHARILQRKIDMQAPFPSQWKQGEVMKITTEINRFRLSTYEKPEDLIKLDYIGVVGVIQAGTSQNEAQDSTLINPATYHMFDLANDFYSFIRNSDFENGQVYVMNVIYSNINSPSLLYGGWFFDPPVQPETEIPPLVHNTYYEHLRHSAQAINKIDPQELLPYFYASREAFNAYLAVMGKGAPKH